MVKAMRATALPNETTRLMFHLSGFAAWMPAAETLRMEGRGPGPRALPAALRRRVSPIGRKALEAAWALLPESGDQPRIILSSRHGEYTRTMGLLTSLAEEDEVSPAEFSLSVHHALAGLLSIASGNHAGHTAIAAGPESCGYGLLEAAACVAEDRAPVLLMHFDESLPDAYDGIGGVSPEASLVFAVMLSPNPADGDPVTLEVAPAAAPGTESPAAAFMDFLCAHRDRAQASGDRMMWRWQRGA